MLALDVPQELETVWTVVPRQARIENNDIPVVVGDERVDFGAGLGREHGDVALLSEDRFEAESGDRVGIGHEDSNHTSLAGPRSHQAPGVRFHGALARRGWAQRVPGLAATDRRSLGNRRWPKRRSFCLIGLREPRQMFSRRPGPEVGYAHDSLRRRCLSGHRARSINSLTFQRSGVASRLLPFTVLMDRRGGSRWAPEP